MIKLERTCTYCGGTVEGWVEGDQIKFRQKPEENFSTTDVFRTLSRGDLTVELGKVHWKQPHPVPNAGLYYWQERMCVG